MNGISSPCSKAIPVIASWCMARCRPACLGIEIGWDRFPREQSDKIFERFYRAAGPRQRVIGGLGMGLYIVAEIIERHGGTITVDSEVGKGSTFTVTLPKKRNG